MMLSSFLKKLIDWSRLLLFLVEKSIDEYFGTGVPIQVHKVWQFSKKKIENFRKDKSSELK